MLIFIVKHKALWSVLSVIYLSTGINLLTGLDFQSLDLHKVKNQLAVINIIIIVYGGFLLHYIHYCSVEYLQWANGIFSNINKVIKKEDHIHLLIMFWCSLSALLGLIGWTSISSHS